MLHVAGRVFIFSARMRACHIFSDTSWLPLRYSDNLPAGDEVEFASGDGVVLRGLFIAGKGAIKRGTILFCHELNGNRSNIAPFAETLLLRGFNIFTFDFRNHGKSDIDVKDYPAPWLTTADMLDVKAAIEYVCNRENYCNDNWQANKLNNLTQEKNIKTNVQTNVKTNVQTRAGIGIFGLGKGATIALCAAGSDRRVKSLVLDAPAAANLLFNKDCWITLVKSAKLSKRTMNAATFFLFLQTVLYLAKQPLMFIYEKWRRYVLGLWYDCQFINIEPIIKKVSQPIMIVHGHVETKICPRQIRAFCERMPQRPKLWLTQTTKQKNISEACRKSVADFFIETK
ncbi:MAG: alpha/beta hydrolase [Planctomycetaceae bacterium]|jgi:pimeloyl-ACP methyl ester carboxylesterase|nr:alpha/beta hydrolase [Planctomycetaceae bacterium]